MERSERLRVRRKILEVAQKLAKMPKDAEYAVVIFEDGYMTPILTQHQRASTLVPLQSSRHGYSIAIIHTHPLPRTTPSLPDLRALLIMASYRIPAYLATVYRGEDEIIITLYIATKVLTNTEVKFILRNAYIYELLHLHHGSQASEKQVREQHRVLQKCGIKVERYRIRSIK